MTEKNYRILVADDHPIFREGVSAIVGASSPDATVEQVGTFDELIALAQQGKAPNMFVLDLCFPGMDLSTSIPTLRSAYPLASIVVVSMADDKPSIDKVMASGVDGFISKASSHDVMEQAFKDLRGGEFVNIGSPTSISTSSISRFSGLTERQRDVLGLIARGMSNKEIGRELAISPFTVRIHVSALMRELGVDSRSAAASLASKYGV